MLGDSTSLPAWAIRNGPAMNILMVVVLAVGWFSFHSLQRESFPNFDLDTILISIAYPGAAPQEVEQGICQKIEEAVRSLDGVKKVTSVASEGSGSVVLELNVNVRNPDRVLDEVRSQIDQIPSFPEEAEEPNIRRVVARRSAIRVAVLGPPSGDSLMLRAQAEQVRDDLLRLDGVTVVDLLGSKDYQIDIEIDEQTLRAHGLTLQRVAEIVRRENRELPAGTLRGDSQEVLLRGNNQRATGAELAELPLITQPGGAVLTVGDLGRVRDEFTDTAKEAYINGRPAIGLTVERSASEDMLLIVDEVHRYVAQKQLPAGYELTTWSDQTVEVRGRLNLLYENATIGLGIVFVLLLLFLEIRLAFWVAMGIPVAILAAMTYLQFTGESLNMVTMFAFLMALGIVVDDAIVVGENIYAHREMGKPLPLAAAEGAREVLPSIFTSVGTTIIAFAPLMFVSGVMGKFFGVMPVVIIAMLVASLLECLTILPSHLAHRSGGLLRAIGVVFYVFAWLVPLAERANRLASGLLDRFVRRVYLPVLSLSLRNRQVVVAGLLAVLILAAGLVRSGVTRFVFFPKIDGNTLRASVAFPDGTPERITRAALAHMEESFWRVNQRLAAGGPDLGVTSFRLLGRQLGGRRRAGGNAAAPNGSHLGSVEVELLKAEDRDIRSSDIAAAWRDEVGEIAGAESLVVGGRNPGPGGEPIEFKLLAPAGDADQLEELVERCKAQLAEFPGVFDIADDSIPGKWEYRFRVRPEAAAMGARTADLAETVRAAYFGEEVMRVQRGRHEVKIMVRYPRDERRHASTFDELRVRMDDGVERPITELAQLDVARGYSELNRINQKRSITVSADLDEQVANAEEIVAVLQAEFFPTLLADYPGVDVLWQGQQEQRRESFDSLWRGFGIALLAMFVLLAFELKSYWQPALILLVIPFGAVGAIGGHALMGMPITLFSVFGLVALSGIVVNDSIVLVDFINNRVRAGMSINNAILEAGARRFRPVMLTTITTVGGLMPILLETSLQAQFLIPMAASIAFGELFATVVVLVLTPVGYSIGSQFAPYRVALEEAPPAPAPRVTTTAAAQIAE